MTSIPSGDRLPITLFDSRDSSRVEGPKHTCAAVLMSSYIHLGSNSVPSSLSEPAAMSPFEPGNNDVTPLGSAKDL
jgi:hypothetical protein